MNHNSSSWICCQLGAREHYAIPRALHQQKQLAHLITDAWVSPQSALSVLPIPTLTKLRERFHPDLREAPVHAFTSSLIHFELAQRSRKKTGWELIIARNHWFQKKIVQYLNTISPKFHSPPILFAYSYAALELFRYAKKKGWYTILGQMDPGLVEEKLVLEEHSKHSPYQSNWQAAPSSYWTTWREECSLADRILVNSPWSKQALEQIGITKNKIDIIPLAYQPPNSVSNFVRTYPLAFSAKRPLRVLFLGQVILRKGIIPLLEAAQLLRGLPIEFWLVGSQGIATEQTQEQVQWIGAVPRSATAKYYQSADVFLFPTLSDGFGMTQLEAQAWKLPVIASRFCGEVVKHRVNGLTLPEVSPEAIVDALLFCLNNPQQLQAFSQQSTNIDSFSLSQLQYHLQTLAYAVF